MNDMISAVANVAIALTFVAALVFGIAQVRAAARDRRERLTLEALHTFQTREFAGLMPRLAPGLHELPVGIELGDSVVADDREYGSTGPFSVQRRVYGLSRHPAESR